MIEVNVLMESILKGLRGRKISPYTRPRSLTHKLDFFYFYKFYYKFGSNLV
jgi:hypothetical protein